MPEIQLESLTQALFDEIVPLGRKCWAENTIAKADTCAWYGERDFEITPDLEQYEALHRAGILVIITLREASRLVGYVTGVCHRALHHRAVISAQNDSFYVEPDFRAYSPLLVEAYEKEMVRRGAQALNWLVHTEGPVYALLKARGYVADESMMEKRVRPEMKRCA